MEAMDMDYRVAAVYRPEDLTGLYNAFLWSKSRKKKVLSKFLHITAAIFSFVLLETSVMLMINAFVDFHDSRSIDVLFDPLMISFFSLALGILLFLVSIRKIGRNRAWKAYRSKGSEIVYQFMPEQFHVILALAETIYPYSVITRFIEDRDRFYLFLSLGHGYILPKRDIPDSAAFCRYIEKATGLSAEQMKKK